MLKLRYDQTEGVIRSVGDPPHGILCVGQNEEGDPSFVVSASWEPKVPIGLKVNSVEIAEGETTGDEIPVDLAELVEAAGRGLLPVIWKAAVMGYEAAHALGLHAKGEISPVAMGVVLMNDTKAEIMRQYGDLP